MSPVVSSVARNAMCMSVGRVCLLCSAHALILRHLLLYAMLAVAGRSECVVLVCCWERLVPLDACPTFNTTDPSSHDGGRNTPTASFAQLPCRSAHTLSCWPSIGQLVAAVTLPPCAHTELLAIHWAAGC
jgi:hypothetical protein